MFVCVCVCGGGGGGGQKGGHTTHCIQIFKINSLINVLINLL